MEATQDTIKNVMRKINDFMNDFDVVDIWRVRNPHARQYTRRQNNPLIQSRLDFWLVSNNMHDFIKDTGIKPACQLTIHLFI